MKPKEGTDFVRQGFQAIDPWRFGDGSFKRRNLPHLEVPGATYFVTFRCRSEIELPAEARDLVMAVVQSCDGESVELDAAVVMPSHVHAIFRLIEPQKLSNVLRRIKGRSARFVNRALGCNGPFWMDESFDHIIRHETELEEKIEYIRQNPVRSGLEDVPENYKWLFVREITG